jgi:DNA repair protein RadD
VSAVQLRDYQLAAIAGLRGGIRAGHRKQVLMSPTGSGKTEIASYMLDEARAKMSRALFIVDRVVLVDQTSQRLDLYSIPHGVIQADHWRVRPYERIQICSAQTLEKRGMPSDIDVVFVDEAHSMRKKVAEFLAATDAVVVGLTATPFTKGMGKVYSNLVSVITMNELIERQYLVPLKIYAARAINVEGMKVVGGEWSEKEIEARGMDIVGDIVSEWQAKTAQHFGGPVKTIVFSATVDHGEELCRQFAAAGFNFKQISYREGNDNVRRKIIEEFKKTDSDIDGLVSCEVFTKGFDVPDVLCGISARPYRKSLSSHIQQMGRVMRASPGKTFGLWLDHSGNAMRFRDDVADIFANSLSALDDGRLESKVRKEPTPKERDEIRCRCGQIMEPWDKKCPSCGHERKRQTMVETQPGVMLEVVDQKKKNKETGWDEKAAFYAGLKHYGDMHNYKPGWAAHKYQERFGVWPNDPRVSNVEATPPDAKTASWIRSQAIRRAKSQHRAGARSAA